MSNYEDYCKENPPPDELVISRKTKSKAYGFVKSLMKDGATGEDVHKLVDAISQNISPEIGGQILMDLLVNPADENADVKFHSYWMGPFDSSWYHCVTEHWADFCEDNEIRGAFRFGREEDWTQWNKARKDSLPKKDLDELAMKCNNQLCVMEWWADDLTSKRVDGFLSHLYTSLQESIKAKAEKEKK